MSSRQSSRHLEACDRCQQSLEELTYQRFSAAEWHPSSALTGDGLTAASAQHRSSTPSHPFPLLDPVGDAEQESRRKRLILEIETAPPFLVSGPPRRQARSHREVVRVGGLSPTGGWI